MYETRADAGRVLAEHLRGIAVRDPLVLAIPRGGVEVGAPLARLLGAELDVVLARKLRYPLQPELAIGAVAESGETWLDPEALELTADMEGEIDAEREFQLGEIERRKALFRAVRPRARIGGRTVIVVDDGLATGSTMIAALKAVRRENPGELIAAVPVAPIDRIGAVRELCDRVVCPLRSSHFWAVGQFYRTFPTVSDQRVVELLRQPLRTAHGDASEQSQSQASA